MALGLGVGKKSRAQTMVSETPKGWSGPKHPKMLNSGHNLAPETLIIQQGFQDSWGMMPSRWEGGGRGCQEGTLRPSSAIWTMVDQHQARQDTLGTFSRVTEKG